MLNREMVMEELVNRGYEVKAQDTIKNGVKLQGICFGSDEVRPLVHLNSFFEEAEEYDLTLEDVVDKIESVLDTETPSINIDELSDTNFAMKHIRIGVQKSSNEELVKRESFFEGIEEYLYLNLEFGTAKITKEIAQRYEASFEELWEKAEINTKANISIKSMGEIMREMMGDNFPFCEEEPNLYVVTNKDRYRGAAGALDKNTLNGLANVLGVKGFAVLPSSIHEMLLVPFKEIEEIDMEELNDMVSTINHTEVPPEERLTDRAYLYEVA